MLPTISFDSTFDPAIAGHSFMERGRALAGRLKSDLFGPPAPEAASSVWYTGLVIDPAEFSQQLSNLYVSVHQANAAARSVHAPVGAGVSK